MRLPDRQAHVPPVQSSRRGGGFHCLAVKLTPVFPSLVSRFIEETQPSKKRLTSLEDYKNLQGEGAI